ncbi:MAG TPA: aminopeptidase P family protein [Pyrinomonadaceae bacterium]|nr:aminopeptidase P family protein [Pyrinomonadaceae bacterium]
MFLLTFANILGQKPSFFSATNPPKISDTERQNELAQRRTKVAEKMADGSILILLSGTPRIYTNDVDYVFRQENNLYYLTALKQKNCFLVMVKIDGKAKEYLFLPKRNPREETWTGKMYSTEDARRLSGIENILDLEKFSALLANLKAKTDFKADDKTEIPLSKLQSAYLLLPMGQMDDEGMREFSQESRLSASLNESGFKVQNARPIFDELRLVKSPYEIKLLQYAIDITTEAIMRSMLSAKSAAWEYQIQAEVEYIFRKRNADYWGYPSIVGCGANATTLHYEEAQSQCKPGELLLMDVGAEYDHYTADVTRTFPINGKFTKEQADIYSIVYQAQDAVAAAAKPGVPFARLSAIARAKIGEGLLKLGLITENNPEQVSVWFMHGLGHWLGMNVHDVGSYNVSLRPGMVFTNEPGIYIRADALDNLPDTPKWNEFKAKVSPAFEKYKNIGVRIEDDMLVTEDSVIWMTAKLPRSINDIENFMASAKIPQ